MFLLPLYEYWPLIVLPFIVPENYMIVSTSLVFFLKSCTLDHKELLLLLLLLLFLTGGIQPRRRGSTWHARWQRPQSDHSGCIGSGDRFFAGLVDSYGLVLFAIWARRHATSEILHLSRDTRRESIPRTLHPKSNAETTRPTRAPLVSWSSLPTPWSSSLLPCWPMSFRSIVSLISRMLLTVCPPSAYAEVAVCRENKDTLLYKLWR